MLEKAVYEAIDRISSLEKEKSGLEKKLHAQASKKTRAPAQKGDWQIKISDLQEENRLLKEEQRMIRGRIKQIIRKIDRIG